MLINSYFGNLHLLRGLLSEFKAVLRQRKRPRHLVLHYNRAFLVVLFLFPNKVLSSNSIYKLLNYAVIVNLTSILLLPIICSVNGSRTVIEMGEAFVWITGVSMIIIKMIYSHLRANEIDDVLNDFDYYSDVFQPLQIDDDIIYWERIRFLFEMSVFTTLFIFLSLFSLAICFGPFLSKQELPFPSVFPFQWHRRAEHPYAHALFYFLQCITSHHDLLSILNMDLLGIFCFIQTAFSLKVLSSEMRKLGALNCRDKLLLQEFRKVIKFHQHIIGSVQKINRVFHESFVTQILASFGMISLSTFEAMAAADEPQVAAKFLLFLVNTFMQLSLWCGAGNLVYSQSLEVGQAAFDINDWHEKSLGIQKDILIVIQRSQHALVYQAKPFPPFTLETYTMILNACYRILTLLREAI